MVLFWSLTTTSFSQKSILFNPRMSHFLLHKGSIMPSSYDFKKVLFSVNYNNRLGFLPEIRDIYLDGAFRKNNHTFGFKVFSDQQTLSFTKDKIAFFYSPKINIDRYSHLAVGAQIGLASIRFGATDNDAGGADLSIDLTTSLSYKNREFEGGLALHQIQNSTLTPVIDEFELSRYFEGFCSYLFRINRNTSYSAGITSQLNLEKFYWGTNHKLSFYEKYDLLFTFGDQYFLSVGAAALLNEEFPVKIGFSYNDYLAPSNRNRKSGTIHINYSF